jgi:protein-tyrosine-phosphatase
MHSYRTHILFIGTTDASCPQLAEAWANHLGGDHVCARAAGFDSDAADPCVAAVLAEIGLIAPRGPVPLTPELLRWAHRIVTLGTTWSAHRVPAVSRARHWTLADPTSVNGTEAERLRAFRAARDETRYRVANLIVELCGHRTLAGRGA